MNHVYVFDYGVGGIYHAIVPDDIVEAGESAVMNYLDLNGTYCYYMVSDRELYIEELSIENK